MQNYTALRTRYISVRFTLDDGTFPNSLNRNGELSNVKVIHSKSDNETLTIESHISMASGMQPPTAQVIIYGMRPDDINALLKVNLFTGEQIPANKVEIFAGYEIDSKGFPPLVYSGQICSACPDYNSPSRSRPFTVLSVNFLRDQNLIADITQVKGKILLNDLFKTIVGKFNGYPTYIGRNIEHTYVENQSYTGACTDQLQAATAHYGYYYAYNNNEGVVQVAPIGQPFSDEVIEISSDNNMLGYPTVIQFGVQVRVRYSPQIRYGQIVNLKSNFDFVNGNRWYINGIDHFLTTRQQEFQSILTLGVNSQFGS